jgi:hypothetical protein
MNGFNSEVMPPSEQAALDIDYQRTCDCAPSHINCLTAKEWIKNPLFTHKGELVVDPFVGSGTTGKMSSI